MGRGRRSNIIFHLGKGGGGRGGGGREGPDFCIKSVRTWVKGGGGLAPVLYFYTFVIEKLQKLQKNYDGNVDNFTDNVNALLVALLFAKTKRRRQKGKKKVLFY